jgi:hypothetical protein
VSWAHTGYGPLPPVAMMRRTLPAIMCLMLGGLRSALGASSFLSLLGGGGGKTGRSFADKPVVTILAKCCPDK